MKPSRPGRAPPETVLPAGAGPGAPGPGGNRVPVLEARQLFGRFQEIRIQHQGEEYRLRITRNQKLILTK